MSYVSFERQNTENKSHQRRNFTITAVAAALLVGTTAFATLGLLPPPPQSDDVGITREETVLPGYSVTHITDRISEKLSSAAVNGAPDLSDTGYRVRTRTLVVDSDKVSSSAGIEDVFSGPDEDIVSRVLYQAESSSSVYDFGDPDEYVAYLDVSGDTEKTGHPQDAVFAYDTTQGEMIEGARYDAETGLAYIPKSLFEEKRVSELAENQSELQAQTLVRYDLEEVREAVEQSRAADVIGDEPVSGEIISSNTVPVEIETESGKVSKMNEMPLVGNQFGIQLVDPEHASEVDPGGVSVSINDGALDLNTGDDSYTSGDNMPSVSYDSETGVLDFYNISPISVLNITATSTTYALPSQAYSRTYIAEAGEIKNPTNNAYKIGHYGIADCRGANGSGERTATLTRWAPGERVWSFGEITKRLIGGSGDCAYIISIGSCPSQLGTSWTASGSKLWKANCFHASYPNGSGNPPAGGYYKVLDADSNTQTVTIAFMITCDSSQQEGSIVLTFKAPRNGELTLTKKANANKSLGTAWKSTVANATFGVYKTRPAAKNKDSEQLVKKITTGSNGSVTADFEKGTYWVRELSCPWPYLPTDEIISFTSKPKSKEKKVLYDDTVPPIQVIKKIVPPSGSFSTGSVGKALAVRTEVAADGKSISTAITAKQDVTDVGVFNLSDGILSSPSSADQRFNAANGAISAMRAGDTVTVSQSIQTGQGWACDTVRANICAVTQGASRADMTLPMRSASLAGTKYGIYSDAACSKKIGETTLDANGIGYYGRKDGENLLSNTTYYIKETGSVNGYTVSSEVFPVTTGRNNQVSVSVNDSFSTLILTKRSGAGKELTDKVSQFTLRGARYGVFASADDAATRDVSKVVDTLDGKPAVIITDQYGQASETALGTGTYYISELPSDIAMVADTSFDGEAPADISAEIKKHSYTPQSNGKFLMDETIHTVNMHSGATTFVSSVENIPVKIQLAKQTTRPELASLAQFSLEGAVFGVYPTLEAARAAQSGNYGDTGFSISADGAVALLFGDSNGTTTVSGALPLADYWIKEIQAPRNYKLADGSRWTIGDTADENEILHLSASDFLRSGKYIDGVSTVKTVIKSNDPKDVPVRVHKDSSEVPEALKIPENAMSLAGARFAIYSSYEDARDDRNRLMFHTDDQPAGAEKVELLTSEADGWTNTALGLPAQEYYWVREIEQPHVISDDAEENARNIEKSMYVLDTEPVRAVFSNEEADLIMTAEKDDAVKPVSITVDKYPYAIDVQGRNLHVGDTDRNGKPYAEAYTPKSIAGALFGLFNTRKAAEAAEVTDDVNDVSVEQKAYDTGAIAVMTSDENGICGTVDNLRWKADGYYVRELKAPTSGCYKRNESVLQISCDGNAQNSEHVHLEVDADKISKTFGIDETPNYYYVKIEKASSDPSVLSDSDSYCLENTHFGLYKTREEAEAATEEDPGTPMYNLYMKKVRHDDGSIHYEATSGLTGPGVFWAKELTRPNGFQALSAPVRVEAKIGGVPDYDKTPIVPEYAPPVPDAETGKFAYKTARDIDEELGAPEEEPTHEEPVPSYFSLLPRAATLFPTMTSVSTYATAQATTTNTNDKFKAANGLWPVYNGSTSVTFYTAKDGTNFYNVNGFLFYPLATNAVTWETYSNTNGKSIKEYNMSMKTTIDKSKRIKKETAYTCEGKLNGTKYDPIKTDAGKRASVTFFPQLTITYNANGGSGTATDTKNIGANYTMRPTNLVSRTGYTCAGWTDVNPGSTAPANQKYKYTGGQVVGAYDWNATEIKYSAHNKTTWSSTDTAKNAQNTQTVTLYACWTANTYTVSFNANGGSNASTARTATYDSAMPAASVPTRAGYIFQGYFDATSGGTKYYNSNGTSARTWNKTAATTLYAQWTPITYYVKFTTTDPEPGNPPAMSGSATTMTCTYGTTYKAPGEIFHKQGHVLKRWNSSIALNGNFSNLSTTNGATVTINGEWDNNRYQVQFDEGLTTQWGPAPVVENGTNPDTGTAWTSPYLQSLRYDNYATDGIAPDKLTRVRYSHPYFDFEYWVDAYGNRYLDQASVSNLATPGSAAYKLTGVWIPALDYGVDCDPNIIINQPLGGISVQKVVKTDSGSPAPAALSDLSGIEFELFSDADCENSVDILTTDNKGIVRFTGVQPATTYWVCEKSLPSRLEGVMLGSDEVMEVMSGQEFSYEFENEVNQRSISIAKKPLVGDSIHHAVLSALPPDGAKFALYNTEEDARADENRITFTDDTGFSTTVATVREVDSDDGAPRAETVLYGLPDKDLWVKELVPADHGKHEYLLSPDPIFVPEGEEDITSVPIFNKLLLPEPGITAYKNISADDLKRLPGLLRDEALSLTSGIQYAIYMDRASAAKRSDNYIDVFDMDSAGAVFETLPYGTYYLVEWDLPEEAVAAGISRSDKVSELTIDSSNADNVELTDRITTEKLYLKKVDADTKDPIPGVIFDIYDDENRENLLCSTTETDATGIAVSGTDLLPGRSYFAVERFDSMPDEYTGQGLGDKNTAWSGWVEVTLGDTSADAAVVENTKNDEKGSIAIHKASNTSSPLSGAVFSVYDSAGVLYAEMVTDENGEAVLDDVPIGSYSVRETRPLDRHSSDDTIYQDEVLPNTVWQVNDGNPVMNSQGFVRVHKESDNPDLVAALSDAYSLAGAVYSLFPVDEDGIPEVSPLETVLTTDESGDTGTIAVPFGKYRVVETTEPAGFSTPQEKKVFDIEVTAENATEETAIVVESVDTPTVEPLSNLIVEKRSAETMNTSDGAPQGETNMGGTRFIVEYSPIQASTYESALASEKTHHWFIDTDDEGRAVFDEENIISEESDEVYRDENGNAALPLGTIVVRETIPPVGYTLGKAPTAAYVFDGGSGKFVELAHDGGESTVLNGRPVFTAANDIYRADILFHKSDAYDSNKKMAGIPFLITMLDAAGEPMEQHLIATDENGDFSTKTGSIDEVNANDEWIPGDMVSGTVPADFSPYDSRVWFSGIAEGTEPSSSRGALIYGDYELREFYRDDTAHYQSLEPIYFSVRGGDDQSWVEMKDGTILTDGNLTEAIGEIQNHSIHIESTEFVDIASKMHTMSAGNTVALETVKYADATPGEEYVFEALAYDADTGEPIMRKFIDEEMSEDNESEVQVGAAYAIPVVDSETGEEIVPVQESGEVSFKIEFENLDIDLRGRNIGLVTSVYHNGYLSDTHNELLEDTDETVSFAKIETEAVDAGTLQHIGFSQGDIAINDTVKFENLVPGEEYTARGILMSADGEALLDEDGSTITGETVFTAEKSDGTVPVEFSFKKPVNTEFTAVVYEELVYKDKVIAEHKKINDKEQTVRYPRVSTIAVDKETRTFQGDASTGTVEVADTVEYWNLVPGQTYEIQGRLYTLDSLNKKKEPAVAEKSMSFVPEEPDGTIEMSFSTDADVIRGHCVLVGEEILSDGKTVAEHDNASFTDQIVSYPKISTTTATDAVTRKHIGNGEEPRTITDIVSVEGLKPDESYHIEGVVWARASSPDGTVDETEITASLDFTATSASEDHTVIFKIPADVEMADAVIYERLFSGDGEQVLAVHEDAEDENQTVHYPKIGTKAWNPDTTAQVGSNIDNKVTDTVSYSNLLPGHVYQVQGMLVDKETGSFISSGEGEEAAPLASRTTFIPMSSSGSVDVEFDLQEADTEGRTIVVYEKLFIYKGEVSELEELEEEESIGDDVGDGVQQVSRETDIKIIDDENIDLSDIALIATHCDIESLDQTMWYPSISTRAKDTSTDSHVGSSLTTAKISDTVSYKNLVPGVEYELQATLKDKASGEPIVLPDGVEVRGSTVFTPEYSDDEVEVVLSDIPAEVVAGKTVVVYEKLVLSGYEMSSHEKINDADQTVFYPDIQTTATDQRTGLHEGNIEDWEDDVADASTSDSEKSFLDALFDLLVPAAHAADKKVRIVDMVSFTNLEPGREYKVSGKIVDKETGETVSQVSEETFTPEDTIGEVKVELAASIEKSRGHVLVVYEYLYDDAGNMIAMHEDIDDENQTVSYPVIDTSAKDTETKTQCGSPDSVSITDTVSYEGLLEGHEYMLIGALMDKGTGEPLKDKDGSVIASSVRFTADPGGTGETEVKFSAEVAGKEYLPGRTVIVFEQLREAPISEKYTEESDGSDTVANEESSDDNTDISDSDDVDDEEASNGHVKVLARHEDIDDEGQSIYYSETPTLDKEIKQGAGWVDKADGLLGEEIEYRLTGTISDNLRFFDCYEIALVDTFGKGLESADLDGIRMYRESESATNDITGAFTATYDKDTGTLRIESRDAATDRNGKGTGIIGNRYGIKAGDTIIAIYKAKVADASQVAKASSADGIENEAHMEYTRYPNSDEMISTDSATAEFYSYALKIEKSDLIVSKRFLPGAEFTVKEKGGKYIGVDDAGRAIYTSNPSVFITDDKGTIDIPGLAARTYVIEETKAPDGYNGLEEPFEIAIDAENRGLVDYLLGGEGLDKKLTSNSGSEIKVLNERELSLPATGKEAAILWAAEGLIIMVLGIAILVYTRRREGTCLPE